MTRSAASATVSIDAGRPVLVAYVLLTPTPLFMATNVVIGRAAMEVMPPMGLAFWRWVVAFAILLPLGWVGLRRHWGQIRRHWRRVLLLGVLGMFMAGGFVYTGLETTTATNAGLIYAVAPVVIVMITWLGRGEPITPRQALGIVVAIAGVVIILTRGHPETILSLDFTVGDLWVLAATIGWGIYSVIIKHDGLAMPTMSLFAAIAGAGVLVIAPFYAAETVLFDRPVVPTPRVMLSIAGVAIVSSVLAFSTYQKGIAVVGPGRAGPFMYLMPAWAAVMAVLFLGEAFQPFHAVGFALIIPGVALATWPGRRA